MITQKKLQEILDYSPDTGLFIWKKKFSKYSPIKIGAVAGTYDNNGYRTIKIGDFRCGLHRLAWYYIYGKWPENQIDHINRIKDDNRICNLREVINQENQFNCKNRKDNISGIKGISWAKHMDKWQVFISLNNKNKYLGCYEIFNDAVKARYNAEIEYGFIEYNKESSSYKYLKENNLI